MSTQDEMGDEPNRITVCQGPPRCDLVGDEAVAAMKAGCPFCQVIHVDPETGEEWETGPVDDAGPRHSQGGRKKNAHA